MSYRSPPAHRYGSSDEDSDDPKRPQKGRPSKASTPTPPRKVSDPKSKSKSKSKSPDTAGGAGIVKIVRNLFSFRSTASQQNSTVDSGDQTLGAGPNASRQGSPEEPNNQSNADDPESNRQCSPELRGSPPRSGRVSGSGSPESNGRSQRSSNGRSNGGRNPGPSRSGSGSLEQPSSRRQGSPNENDRSPDYGSSSLGSPGLRRSTSDPPINIRLSPPPPGTSRSPEHHGQTDNARAIESPPTKRSPRSSSNEPGVQPPASNQTAPYDPPPPEDTEDEDETEDEDQGSQPAGRETSRGGQNPPSRNTGPNSRGRGGARGGRSQAPRAGRPGRSDAPSPPPPPPPPAHRPRRTLTPAQRIAAELHIDGPFGGIRAPSGIRVRAGNPSRNTRYQTRGRRTHQYGIQGWESEVVGLRREARDEKVRRRRMRAEREERREVREAREDVDADETESEVEVEVRPKRKGGRGGEGGKGKGRGRK